MSTQPQTTVNFLPSCKHATDPSDAPALRTCDEDGTHHWSQIKKIGDSGKQYLHAVNTPVRAHAGHAARHGGSRDRARRAPRRQP
jgi:hypothetical protein